MMASDEPTVRPAHPPASRRSRPRNKPHVQADRDALSRPRYTLVTSLWFGLIVGLAELALTLVQKPLTDPSPGLFRMNRHIVWTIPTVNLVVFMICGLAVSIVVRIAPRLGARVVVVPLALLGTLTLLLSLRWLHVVACLVLAPPSAWRSARFIEAHFPGFRRLVRLTLPVTASLAAGVIGVSLGGHLLREHRTAAQRPPTPAKGKNAPNVLLVVLDTVRADHLSLHDYPRQTSPHLVRLARRGITFQQARSTAPWTLPSHASMMTGRWPHELSTGINRPLDRTHRTLAESLAARGYATGGFVANVTYCGVETGLDRGFDHFEDHPLSIADVLWTTALGQRLLLNGIFGPERRARGNPNDYHRKDAAQIRRDLLSWVIARKTDPSSRSSISTTPMTRIFRRPTSTAPSGLGPAPRTKWRPWSAGSLATKRR